MDKEKLKTELKRFLFNANTLSFFLVIVAIVIIYAVYSWRVDNAVKLVNIPYATKLLKADTVIKQEDIGFVKVSGDFIAASRGALIQNRMQVQNKQVKSGYQIPANSFFYDDAITEKNESATDDFYDIPDGYTIYALKVDFHTTYGNSIMPNNYIDLYFKSKNKDGKLIFEKFISSIKVYKVYDSTHKDVFSNADDEEEAKPKYLYFSVPQEIYDLLMICEKIGGIEIIPVPRNAQYSESPAPTEIYNVAISEYITLRRYEIGM